MEDEKLSGRVIIDTILANMRQQVEELRYSKIVPAAYDVYLHTDDQQRFESLAHEIAAEAVRALQERLDALNRPSRLYVASGRGGAERLLDFLVTAGEAALQGTAAPSLLPTRWGR